MKLRFYRQHSLETCGISCVLMVLDAFRRVRYPIEKQERKLYEIYRCKAFKGVLASSIADCLSKNELDVEVYLILLPVILTTGMSITLSSFIRQCWMNIRKRLTP